MNLDIIYEDNKMIICNKPSGVLAQSAKSFDMDMVSALMTYRKKKSEDTYVGVINRLDRQVSGLMVFAKSSSEAARLNRLMQTNSFNKNYYAIICGKPATDKAVFVDYLLKDGRNNISKVVSEKTTGAKRAELEYEFVEARTDREGNEYSLVKIHLITGRHHQIRVQFANRNMPLVGDRKYSQVCNCNGKYEQIFLCAYQLRIKDRLFELNYDKELVWEQVLAD